MANDITVLFYCMCIDLTIRIIDFIITPRPRCTDLHLSERVNKAQAQTREPAATN